MKRILLISLALLLGISTDQLKAQNTAAILAANGGRNYTQVETGPNGEQVFLNIGDSNADGRGTTLGPNTTAGTFYNWNGSGFDEITTTDVSNGGALGTYLKQFAVNYNTRTGYKIHVVQKGSGGSNFYPDGDANNWYTTGDRYVDARTEAREAMVIAGVTKLKAIFITLGVNDNRANTTLSLIQSGVNSLIARLTSDFPNTPIILNQVGRSEVGSPSSGEESFGARLYAIRGYLIDAAKNNTNVYLLSAPITGIGLSGSYKADNLHYEQVLNNYIGAQLDRLLMNKDSYSKWAACIMSSMFDDISSGRKTALATFVDAEIANGNFWKMEFFAYFKTTVQENCFVDWTFRGYIFNNTSVTFSANNYLSSNGTSNHYAYTYYSGINTANASATDFINGVFLLDNLTASGTSATLFGGGPTSTLISVGQNTTPAETWRSNDATISTYATEGSFVDGNFYGTGRNGGTKYLYKNSTQVASASVSVVGGNSTILPVLGAINSNGTITSRISGQYQYLIAAPLTTFDLPSLLTNANALVASW